MSSRSRALGGCARRLLLEMPGLPVASMSCPHRAPAGDSPPASPCFFLPLMPPGWSSGSGPGWYPSAAPLRAVASFSGHWLSTARGKRGSSTGGCEAGPVGRPGPLVAPQVISAPARTHVDKSRSPVRARGAPGQPVGRSVRATSIPLRLPRLGLPSVWSLPRCWSGAGVCVCRRASQRVCVGGMGRGPPGRRWLGLARLLGPLHSSLLALPLDLSLSCPQDSKPRKKINKCPFGAFFPLKIRSPPQSSSPSSNRNFVK